MSRTNVLGVDLAAQDANTAACLLADRRVQVLEVGVSDERIVELARQVELVAIDAPLGWPREFSRRVAAYAAGEPWPDERAGDLWLRRTDRFVAERWRFPLSVSSDRIARAAVRAVRLLTMLGGQPRDGSGRVAEVYPAGALVAWDIPTRAAGEAATRYKGLSPGAAEVRRRIRDELLAQAEITATDDQREELARTDHALDALIAALVGRAIIAGLAFGPAPEDEEIAAREGWIWMPAGEVRALAAGEAAAGGRSARWRGSAAGSLRGVWGDSDAWLERERASWDRSESGRRDGDDEIGAEAPELDGMLRAMTLSDAAATHLRWNADALEAALHEFGAFTAAKLAESLPGDGPAALETVNGWVRDGRVFAIGAAEGRVFPAFQFAASEPRPVIARVLAALDGQLTGRETLLWFTGSCGHLEGARPVDRLETDAEAVVAAAAYQASLSRD